VNRNRQDFHMRPQFLIGLVATFGVTLGHAAPPPEPARNPLIIKELPAIYNSNFEKGLVFSKLAQPTTERI
jgi:hypothetical protein